MNTTQRLSSLDGLKGIGAFSIAFFYHYRNDFCNFGKIPLPFNTHATDWLFVYGYLFVELFFMISGFVMFAVYLEKVMVTKISLGNYLIKRLIRLYPLMLVTLIFSALFQMYNTLTLGERWVHGDNTLINFIFSAFGLQSGFFLTKQSFNSPSWSVSIFIICYLFFWLIAYHSSKIKQVITCSLIIVYLGINTIICKWNVPLFNRPTARGMTAFFIGGLIYLLWKYRADYQKYLTLLFSGYALFLTVLAIAGGGYGFFGNLNLVFILSIWPYIVWMSVSSKLLSRLLSLPPVQFLGKISFSIYLWNFPAQMLFDIINRAFHLNFNYSSIYIWIIQIPFQLIIAFLSYYFLEMKLALYLSNRFQDLRHN